MTSTALALALLLECAAAPPVVSVESADPVLRGALALALVDDGAVVVPMVDDAGINLRVIADGAGLQLATIGASERAATVAAGPPALVELEALHRALALVRATPARAAEPPAAVFLDVDDRALRPGAPAARLAETLASALLDAAVPLAEPTRAVERLCVMATTSELTLSWGATGARCDGRQMGIARAGLSPSAVVADALRLRDAAAAPRPWRSGGSLAALPSTPSAPPPAPPSAVPTSVTTGPLPGSGPPVAAVVPSDAPLAPPPPAVVAAAPSAAPPAEVVSVSAPAVVSAEAPSPRGGHVEVDLRVGALGRLVAVDPLVDATLLWPIWRELGVGPAGWLAVSGALAPVPIAELGLGGGLGGAWRVAEDVQISAALVAGGFAHGWAFAEGDAGIAFDGLLAAPLTVAWSPGVLGASLALTPGAITRSRTHQIQGEVAWQRSAVFLGISAGLTWDIPPGGVAVENSAGATRGDGDG